MATIQIDRIKASSIRIKGHARTIDAIGGTQQGMFVVGASYYIARCACGWNGGQWLTRHHAERDHGDHKAEIARQGAEHRITRRRISAGNYEVDAGHVTYRIQRTSLDGARALWIIDRTECGVTEPGWSGAETLDQAMGWITAEHKPPVHDGLEG